MASAHLSPHRSAAGTRTSLAFTLRHATFARFAYSSDQGPLPWEHASLGDSSARR
jgi:hypothetical protein